jgi:two-component system response regulator FlrC
MARVMVFDEDSRFRQFLVRALELVGHRVRAFDSAERATETLAGESFDVVVLELRAPRMDGMGVLRFVSRWLPETGAVMIAADGTPAMREEAAAWGAVAVLAKPLNGPQELQQAVAQAAGAPLGRSVERR